MTISTHRAFPAGCNGPSRGWWLLILAGGVFLGLAFESTSLLRAQDEEEEMEDVQFEPASDVSETAPQMAGDFGGGSLMYIVGGLPPADAIHVPIPLAGGTRRLKIGENNQVPPLDRVFMTYNHFHNGLVMTERAGSPGGPLVAYGSSSIDQFTVGFEKAFLCNDCSPCNDWSVALRMPFSGGADFTYGSPVGVTATDSVGVEAGEVGNLQLDFKKLICLNRNQPFDLCVGVGLNFPTGGDVRLLGDDGDVFGFTDDVTVRNEAMHVMPFLGFYYAWDELTRTPGLWLQAFAQLDFDLNGNSVIDNVAAFDYGPLNEQTLAYLDLQLGYWLYRNPCSGHGLTGLAAFGELHYTAPLNDADGFVTDAGIIGNPQDGNPAYANTFGVLNATLGARVELGNTWFVNIACALPLRNGYARAIGRRDNRFYDSELLIQVNRYF